MSEVTYDFSGRTAVVTGGAQGIGLAIVKRLREARANVSVWDVAAPPAGVDAQHVVVDITSADATAAAAMTVKQRFGGIDMVVNSAGIAGANAKVEAYDPAEWRRILDINLTGAFLVARACVPHLRASNAGRLVNIASIAGKDGNPNAAAYSASKAGVISLTKSLGKELADTPIRVNAITPAAVRTAIFDQMTQQHIDFMLSRIPMARFGQVEEIAALAAWLCSADCSFSTGAVFDASGGRAVY